MAPWLLLLGCAPPSELTLLVGDCDAGGAPFDVRVPHLDAAAGVSVRAGADTVTTLLCPDVAADDDLWVYAWTTVRVRGVGGPLVSDLLLRLDVDRWEVTDLDVAGDLSIESTGYGTQEDGHVHALLEGVHVGGRLAVNPWFPEDVLPAHWTGSVQDDTELELSDVVVDGEAVLAGSSAVIGQSTVGGGLILAVSELDVVDTSASDTDGPGLWMTVLGEPGRATSRGSRYEGSGGDVVFHGEQEVPFEQEELGEEWECRWEADQVDCG